MPAVALVEPAKAQGLAKQMIEAAQKRFGQVPVLTRALAQAPEVGKPITDFMIAILRDGRVDWKTKELLILKTLRASHCTYGIAHHEQIALKLGIPAEKLGDLSGENWKRSPHFTDAERVMLEFVEQVVEDANDVTDELWNRCRKYWREDQLLEMNAAITTFLMLCRAADALAVADPLLFKQ